MPNNMLSGIALAAVVGPIAAFMEKLSGEDGELWLTAFKRFLRKENPWVEFEPAPDAQCWTRISDTEIEVDLDMAPKLSHEGMSVLWTLSERRGRVRIEKKRDELFQDGAVIVLHTDDALKNSTVPGDKLHERMKHVSGHLHPNVLDALLENVHLIPESWKGLRVYFWAVGFRLVGGSLVRGLNWGASSKKWFPATEWGRFGSKCRVATSKVSA